LVERVVKRESEKRTKEKKGGRKNERVMKGKNKTACGICANPNNARIVPITDGNKPIGTPHHPYNHPIH
jgi:hypothetical protein